MVNDKEVTINFSDLPADIYSEIASRLAPRDIFRLCGTNRTIRSYLLNDALLWQTLLGIHFQLNPYNPLPASAPFTYKNFLISYIKTYSTINEGNLKRTLKDHIPLITAVKMGDTESAIAYIKEHKTESSKFSKRIDLDADLTPFDETDLFQLAVALNRTELIRFVINEYGLLASYDSDKVTRMLSDEIKTTLQNFCEAIIFSKPLPTNLNTLPKEILRKTFHLLMKVACMYRCLPAVIELVRILPTINMVDPLYEMTPLMIACDYDDVAAINYLLSKGASTDSVNFQSWTALYYACRRNSLAAVEALIKHKANVNHQSKYSPNPLAQAAHFAGVEVINALLQAGATTDPAALGDNQPLHHTIGRAPNITQLLIDNQAPSDYEFTNDKKLFLDICMCSNFDTFYTFILNGVDILFPSKKHPPQLLEASLCNIDSEICRYILHNTNYSFDTFECPMERFLNTFIIYHDRQLQKELLEKYLHDFIDQRTNNPDQIIHTQAAQALLASIQHKTRPADLTELLEASSNDNLMATHAFALKEKFLTAEPTLIPPSPKLSKQNATLFKKRRLPSSEEIELKRICYSPNNH